MTPPGVDPLSAELCAPPRPHDRVGVVVIHGGGGVVGDRTTVAPWADRLAASGYLTLAVDYRLADLREPGPVFPRQEIDVKHAVRWLRANAPRLGITRIVAFGLSHGASLAATLLVTSGDPRFSPPGSLAVSDRIDGMVGFYGYYDGFNLFPETYYGGQRGLQASNSAIDRVAHATGPVLLVHGTLDAVVPVGQSERFDAALDRAGVASDVVLAGGQGHCFDHDAFRLSTSGELSSATVVGWLDAHF